MHGYRFKKDMWEQVAKELNMPWRAAEDMHWQMGKFELAHRAGVPPFTAATAASSTQNQPNATSTGRFTSTMKDPQRRATMPLATISPQHPPSGHASSSLLQPPGHQSRTQQISYQSLTPSFAPPPHHQEDPEYRYRDPQSSESQPGPPRSPYPRQPFHRTTSAASSPSHSSASLSHSQHPYSPLPPSITHSRTGSASMPPLENQTPPLLPPHVPREIYSDTSEATSRTRLPSVRFLTDPPPETHSEPQNLPGLAPPHLPGFQPPRQRGRQASGSYQPSRFPSLQPEHSRSER